MVGIKSKKGEEKDSRYRQRGREEGERFKRGKTELERKGRRR